jgi:hypothetical protein
MWQDTVILVLNMVFGLTLVPQIRSLHRNKTSMSILSCGTTLAALLILGVTYASLSFWLAVCGDAIDVVAWSTLLGLSIKHAR